MGASLLRLTGYTPGAPERSPVSPRSLPMERIPESREGSSTIVRTNMADYGLPMELPTEGPLSSRLAEAEGDQECEGTCCIMVMGFCKRRQDPWRRTCIHVLYLGGLLFHLWLVYALLMCCGCCQSQDLENIASINAATVAEATTVSNARANTSISLSQTGQMITMEGPCCQEEAPISYGYGQLSAVSLSASGQIIEAEAPQKLASLSMCLAPRGNPTIPLSSL